MADNANLARSLYEAWNERNFDLATEAMAPDGQIIDMGSGQTWSGPDGARQYNQMWANAVPDGRITIDRVVSAGDTVVVEYTGQGTHTGTLETPMGPIPATGRSITQHLCDVNEFSNGKLKVQRTYLDSGSLMVQLGLTEQAATTKQ
ncbi:MAG: ester cyclase [Nocardioidaceae bacterium]